ncbi:MAG: antitoxin VbhA family protein [Candidatus Accumulibacter sp.]|jgi:hypothetical protein|nr:antitoxin VbhA family protein [Accumulibacter sp.]
MVANPIELPNLEELARRRKDVEFARVNVELEGQAVSGEHETLLDAYARGEISLEELGERVDRMIHGAA